MKLAINCAKCGRLLGFYNGAHFTLVSDGLAWAMKVLCDDCDPFKGKIEGKAMKT
jgi:hypothetical protein